MKLKKKGNRLVEIISGHPIIIIMKWCKICKIMKFRYRGKETVYLNGLSLKIKRDLRFSIILKPLFSENSLLLFFISGKYFMSTTYDTYTRFLFLKQHFYKQR